jgi:hypothetical protein
MEGKLGVEIFTYNMEGGFGCPCDSEARICSLEIENKCLSNGGTSFSAPILGDPVTVHPVRHVNFHFSF